jgi:hypothetical protein
MSNKVIAVEWMNVKEKYLPLFNSLMRRLHIAQEDINPVVVQNIRLIHDQKKFTNAGGLCATYDTPEGKITVIYIHPFILTNSDMLTVCHEVAHFLLQHDSDGKTSEEHETEANLWAIRKMELWDMPVNQTTKSMFKTDANFNKAWELYKKERRAQRKEAV